MSEETRSVRGSFPHLPMVAAMAAAALWFASLALPVWETRSDFDGHWATVPGLFPALLGWMGILFGMSIAWAANLFLIPLCVSLFRRRRTHFPLSAIAFAIAATAYFMHAI